VIAMQLTPTITLDSHGLAHLAPRAHRILSLGRLSVSLSAIPQRSDR
jgi:hypothetical protein